MNTKTPKSDGFYMPAEWHPHERCWMAWPCHLPSWSKVGIDRARKAYARVAKAIAQFEPVIMIVNPGDEQSARSLLPKEVLLFSLPINDSWTRDTGPTFLLNKDRRLAGIDWVHNAWGGNYEDYELDNQIANAVLKHSNATTFHAPLVMEGGSFHVDGEGTVLTTKECLLNLNRNPDLTAVQIEQTLCNYLGASHFIWLNRGLVGDETDGHIDEVACFIAPGKVLCLVTHDKEDPNYYILQENLDILQSTKDAQGRKLDVVTIEQPPAVYANEERLTLSYVNFYIANGGIVMPAFGYEAYDKNAFDLMRKLFPSYTIAQVDALDVFAGGGGIHCITQQQPKSIPD